MKCTVSELRDVSPWRIWDSTSPIRRSMNAWRSTQQKRPGTSAPVLGFSNPTSALRLSAPTRAMSPAPPPQADLTPEIPYDLRITARKPKASGACARRVSDGWIFPRKGLAHSNFGLVYLIMIDSVRWLHDRCAVNWPEARAEKTRKFARERPACRDLLDETRRPRGHYPNPISQHRRLVQAVGNQHHGGLGLSLTSAAVPRPIRGRVC